jgi:hypothetical protein
MDACVQFTHFCTCTHALQHDHIRNWDSLQALALNLESKPLGFSSTLTYIPTEEN